MKNSSLQALKELRLGGSAPKLVWLIVGDCPSFVEPSIDMIRIAPTDQPAHIDFRSLVMLDVTIYEIGKYSKLFKQTIKAVEAAKPAALFLACRAGMVGIDAHHEVLLDRAWRMLSWQK
jgi:hypothetical protein